jgi:hypothetical protein
MGRNSFVLAFLAAAWASGDPVSAVRAIRHARNPIITESMLPGEDGGSINGPALIRAPGWVRNPLGRYYLYFAHHSGHYIRFAYAERPEGPWKVRPGGVLNLKDQKAVTGHVASPDAVVDDAARRVYLFYHGKVGRGSGQQTSVAVSEDGIHFRPLDVVVGPAYLRVFQHENVWYAMTGRGALLKGPGLGGPFQPVGQVIGPEIPAALDPVRREEADAKGGRPAVGADRYSLRHLAVDAMGSRLAIYFTCVGHRPERIFATFVDLKGAPETWRARGVVEVLRPTQPWEGAGLPLEYSKGGRSRARENGLRDPAVYREDGRAWLLYSTAGEHGIGIAELHYGEDR